jgi:hypothetical protein
MPCLPAAGPVDNQDMGRRSKAAGTIEGPLAAGQGWRYRLLSLLILFHVAAVVLAPFAFATSSPEGTSPLVAFVSPLFRGYSEFAFLNHGYAFFAPDPGPSVLMRGRMEFTDGRPPVERVFPDLGQDFPRLFYHRHFMLSEQLNMLFVPEEPPDEIRNDPGLLLTWRGQRAAYERRRSSFVRHLRQRYGAERVTLTRVEHRLASPAEVLGGLDPHDPALWRDLSETPPPSQLEP